MFRAIILPIFRSTRPCVTACGIMHPLCCRPPAGNIVVKQISDNEIYLLIKYIKSFLWREAKRLSYKQDARCLKAKEETRLFCVRTQSVPHSKHSPLRFCETSLLMLYKAKVAVCSEIYTEPIKAM